LWSAVSLTLLTIKKVEFIVEYLREYEAICNKALTRVSGAQMELFDEKKTEVENLVTGSLSYEKVREIIALNNTGSLGLD
jgi:hypothetical protein